ncbi:hypothetical protein E0H50_02005 [Kribbella sindirgiensis]|uniref:Uncharacterized protein n=1 Tax=Kribbella sindirgiensis TaxID=1124744 RepID=A0A4R0JCG3_9ACTN|nr:hypothetical protein E0H50_02005 [Kribbella sindirgiensis]
MRWSAALPRLAVCAGRTAVQLVRRRIRFPRGHVGQRVRFADGSTSWVYRETVLEGPAPLEPCVLIVQFRLRRVRGLGHRAFRAESWLNTPLFAGFPGFVSKLWFAADESGVYRGLYDWDGPDRADAYVRALWWPLALVSELDSIQFRVLPGLRRDDVIADPACSGGPAEPSQWWRPTESW